jgi:class 3 adenylate cyclase
MSAPLYVKDPAVARYVAGGLAEVEALLGAPLPDLPPTERDDERDVFLVHVHSRLRSLLERYLEALLAQIGVLPGRGGDPARDMDEYEGALARVLRAVRAADRGQGLLNLFWLAHSREVAEHLRHLEGRASAVRRGKLSLFPLLQSFYRRLDAESRQIRAGEAAAAENPALVASLIDDGFAFTELRAAELDLESFLASNKRYRIAPEAFFEIQQILVRETERRLREGDRGLLSRAVEHLPGVPREHYLKPSSLLKMVLSGPLLTYLLADPFGSGARLQASPLLRAEVERRRGNGLFDAFLDLTVGLRRFEILSHVRDRVVLLGLSPGARDLDEKTRLGLRLYEFGEATRVLNNAVMVTILFLDLRGFTKTSEGQISERDLTRELYTVFDDFVPIIEGFGGTVDKYLGDGMMVTWGTARADPLDPLNALRAAILCQEALARMRDDGRTWFKMGIAIHHGRVYLARFLAGRQGVQATVIGRNVNLAGRLSSATRRSVDDESVEPPAADSTRASDLKVTVTADGTLVNEGIVISRETLLQLETHLALVHGEDGLEYEDEAIDRRILVRYAGDAKFKGVRSSLPVYDVDHQRRA